VDANGQIQVNYDNPDVIVSERLLIYHHSFIVDPGVTWRL
jgi:hypothetical protein